MIAERSPEVKKAIVRLIELSADEKARALYEAREKERRDNRAREKGARHAGMVDVARNALQMKIGIEDIIKLTGLTREEVEGLRQ